MKADYSNTFYANQSGPSKRSAEAVLPLLLELTGPLGSVIDLGCGVGSWLSFLHNQGISVLGVDGDYVARTSLMIPETCFLPLDLATGDYAAIQGRYDLALSLEVAEHLPEAAAGGFVAKLCSLSDVVLFSAAIPHQKGVNHVNCQWQGYWQKKFAANGFVGIDSLRKRVWYLSGIKHHYKQNMILYVRRNTPLHERLHQDADFIPDVVHPSVYLRSQEDCEYNKSKRVHVRLKKLLRAVKAALTLGGAAPQAVPVQPFTKPDRT